MRIMQPHPKYLRIRIKRILIRVSLGYAHALRLLAALTKKLVVGYVHIYFFYETVFL